jgi:hypothetical protein
MALGPNLLTGKVNDVHGLHRRGERGGTAHGGLRLVHHLQDDFCPRQRFLHHAGNLAGDRKELVKPTTFGVPGPGSEAAGSDSDSEHGKSDVVHVFLLRHA